MHFLHPSCHFSFTPCVSDATRQVSVQPLTIQFKNNNNLLSTSENMKVTGGVQSQIKTATLSLNICLLCFCKGQKLHKHSPQAWWVCEWMPTPRRRGRVTDGKGSGRNAEGKLEWTVKFPEATGDNGASFSCSFFSWILGCHSDGFPVQRNTKQHCNSVTQTEHSLFTERTDPKTMIAEDQILWSPAFRVGALLSYG